MKSLFNTSFTAAGTGFCSMERGVLASLETTIVFLRSQDGKENDLSIEEL